MPLGKDISNGLREATVAAYQSGKGYETISKQFGVQNSTVRKITSQCQLFKTVASPPKVDITVDLPKGQPMQCSKEK